MDWANERYVRLYTRDTATWKLLDWRARTVLLHLIRKVDRAGVLDVGDDGIEGLAAVLELPLEIVEPGIDQLTRSRIRSRPPTLLHDGGTAYVLPNFIEAQETPQSDPQRKRESRARRRELAMHRSRFVTGAAGQLALPPGDEETEGSDSHEQPGRIAPAPSRNVTGPAGFVPQPGRPVTSGHSYPDPVPVPDPEDLSRVRARAIPPRPATEPEPHRPAHEPASLAQRQKINGDTWAAAKLAHDLLRTTVDPGAVAWTIMPSGPGGSDLTERTKELVQFGDEAYVREVHLRVIAVRVEEAKLAGHLKYFIPTRVYERDSFWKSAELSPQQAAQKRAPAMRSEPREMRVVRADADDAPPPLRAFTTKS